MNCPSCDLTLRVKSTRRGADEQGLFAEQELFCINKHCPYGRSGAPVMKIRHSLPAGESTEGAVYCCDRLLCRITGTRWFAAPAAAPSLDGTTLTATCPVCGQTQTFDVAGKTREE